jgi:hypothetical protein
MLLTPLDLLTKDDTWINRTDMVRNVDRLPAAVEDARHRALINNYLQERLSAKPTYELANGTSNSVKVIICYTEEDQTKVTKLLEDLDLSTDASVVVIDARSDNEPSASTA